MAFNCKSSCPPPFTHPSFSGQLSSAATSLKLCHIPFLKFCKPTTSCFKLNCTSHGPNFSPSSSSFVNPFTRRRKTNAFPLILRDWVEADHPLLASPERFTVASYNILADINVIKHRYLYRNVASYNLRWGGRKKLISNELMQWNPDVICLQEVDKYSDLMRIMEKEGYSGSYKRRTGRCKDGCAMFWKVDRLHLLEMESIEFNDFGLRNNVAQLALFQADG